MYTLLYFKISPREHREFYCDPRDFSKLSMINHSGRKRRHYFRYKYFIICPRDIVNSIVLIVVYTFMFLFEIRKV